MNKTPVHSALFGLAVGDALGVPVEFKDRYLLNENPVTGMKAYGSHHQPAGTWSDDSSLAFCLAESLCNGYDLNDLANRFVDWYEMNYWTPHGMVFDIGISTRAAIYSLKQGVAPTLAGGSDEQSNGNGSLMRILPLLFYIQHKLIEERYQITKEVSSLTHRHLRSVISCFIYLEIALEILKGKEKYEAFHNAVKISKDFLEGESDLNELLRFHRLFATPGKQNEAKLIYEYPQEEISSSGYVVHTLEASIWCFLTTDTYKDAVLKAVNLGSDTDTTGAVTGGLAGLYYGTDSIPQEWLDVIAKKKQIADLADRLLYSTTR